MLQAPILSPCHVSPWFSLEGEVLGLALGLEGKVLGLGLECQVRGLGLAAQVLANITADQRCGNRPIVRPDAASDAQLTVSKLWRQKACLDH